MDADPEDKKRMEELTGWFEKHQEIPNCYRIIQKLRKDQQVGNLVNAEFVKKFHESSVYQITDVESSDGKYDIDIQLNGTINIQTWHGQTNKLKGRAREEYIKNRFSR